MKGEQGDVPTLCLNSAHVWCERQPASQPPQRRPQHALDMLPPARPHTPALLRCAEETHAAGMLACWKTSQPVIQPASHQPASRAKPQAWWQSLKHGARCWSTCCHCMRSAQHYLQQPCQCDALAEWVSVSSTCLQQQCRVGNTTHNTVLRVAGGTSGAHSQSVQHKADAASIHARDNTRSRCCRVLLLGLCTTRRLHLPHEQAVHCCCCHAGS